MNESFIASVHYCKTIIFFGIDVFYTFVLIFSYLLYLTSNYTNKWGIMCCFDSWIHCGVGIKAISIARLPNMGSFFVGKQLIFSPKLLCSTKLFKNILLYSEQKRQRLF